MSTEEKKEIDSGEEHAAIAMALHEYLGNNVHDTESMVLTINRVSQVYYPWSSKAFMLCEIPKR
ncbi:hypothetical protein EZS27_000378 [termite gut metagenome]|uniref:Uncharacterized protein n=1 Tax=termite gut metagenome TaxID=433724 RepID=A0A5J4T151_9ZZZZ